MISSLSFQRDVGVEPAIIDFFLRSETFSMAVEKSFFNLPDTTSASFGPQVTNPHVISCCPSF